MSTPEVHAYLSASSAHRWLNCTAAPGFEATFPKGEAGVHAAEGTLAHSVCELFGKHMFGLITDLEREEGMRPIMTDDLYRPEMLHTASAYADYLKEKSIGYQSAPAVMFEQRVDFSKYVPNGFGTCDCIMIGDDHLHITDYKHGKGVAVAAKDNPQMRLYALGALEMFGPLYDIHTVSMGICQPRLHADVEEDEISVEDLYRWAEDYVRPRAEAAFEGRGEFHPGEHCRWCAGKAVCRARANEALTYEAVAAKPLDRLTNAEVGELIAKAKWLSDWYDSLAGHAEAELLQGRAVPGYKLVEGRSVRSFDDADAALATIEAAGWDSAMLYNRKPKTLKELEDMIGKKKFAEIVGNHIVKPAGKPTLAPDSDRRKSYSTAEADFKDII